MMVKHLLFGAALLSMVPTWAQEQHGGQLHGNFQLDGQWYLRDENIDPTGEFYPDERFLGQGYANFIYSDGDFSGGLRYENYQNVMLGFPEGYRGEGITYRFLRFKQDNIDVPLVASTSSSDREWYFVPMKSAVLAMIMPWTVSD